MADSSDSDKADQQFINGQRSVWTRLLKQSIVELGHDDSMLDAAHLLVERHETVTLLRRLCEEYGDNNWPDSLHLSDVIEKHLFRYIEVAVDEDRSPI